MRLQNYGSSCSWDLCYSKGRAWPDLSRGTFWFSQLHLNCFPHFSSSLVLLSPTPSKPHRHLLLIWGAHLCSWGRYSLPALAGNWSSGDTPGAWLSLPFASSPHGACHFQTCISRASGGLCQAIRSQAHSSCCLVLPSLLPLDSGSVG